MASGLAARASSGVISGSGLAMAKITGRSAMPRTMSWVIAPFTDRPNTASAPSSAWASVRAAVSDAWADFHWFRSVPAAMHDALGVAQDDVLGARAHRLDQLHAGDGGGAGAVDHQPGVRQLAVGQVAGVDQAGGGDDGGAVLVVVEDRDVHQLAQALLDDEAFRRAYVLEVDAAEAGAEEAHAVDELVDVLGGNLEVDAVDVGEALEQRDLALHHRLAGERAEIAQAEHGGAVGDHGDHVAAGGVFVGERRVAAMRRQGSATPGE